MLSGATSGTDARKESTPDNASTESSTAQYLEHQKVVLSGATSGKDARKESMPDNARKGTLISLILNVK